MSTASEAAHLEAAMEAAAASAAEGTAMEDVELPPLGGAEPNPNPPAAAAPAVAAAAPVRYVLATNANQTVVCAAGSRSFRIS